MIIMQQQKGKINNTNFKNAASSQEDKLNVNLKPILKEFVTVGEMAVKTN